MSISMNISERAARRAMALSHRSTRSLLRERLGNAKNVRAFEARFGRGLKTRAAIELASDVFDVPPAFWFVETPADQLRTMIDAPRGNR